MSATNRVLAGPSGDCCFTGFRHEGTPIGNKITIANVPTYFVESSSSKGDSEAKRRILIFLADVYGPFYQNNMLVQDFLAQNGMRILAQVSLLHTLSMLDLARIHRPRNRLLHGRSCTPA